MIRPKRRARVVEREVEGEFVLHDPPTDRTFLLNPVSAAIWDLCDGENTVEEIAQCIAEHFQGHDKDEVLKDTMEAIDKLQSENIIVNAEP